MKLTHCFATPCVITILACTFEPLNLSGYLCVSDADCPASQDLRCDTAKKVCVHRSANVGGGGSKGGGGSNGGAAAGGGGSLNAGGGGGGGSLNTGGESTGMPELLSSGEPFPGQIAVDETRVSWGHAQGFSAHPLRGCETLDCAQGAQAYSAPVAFVRGLLSDGGLVYLSLANGVLGKCNPADCLQATDLTWFVGNNGFEPQRIAIRDATIYWTDKLKSGVYKCAKSLGCGAAPSPIVAAGQDKPIGIAVSPSQVYWTNANQVLRCPLSGCAGSPEVVVDNVPSIALTLDDQNLYWAGYVTSGAVQKCALSDCANTITTLAEDQSLPTTLASDGQHVYWTCAGSNQVKRCRVGGCASLPDEVAAGQNEPYGLALSSTHVYWTNRGDGTVMRAEK